MNNDTNTNTNAPLTHAERLAKYSNASSKIEMPTRATDRSRNGMRGARTQKRRFIR